jgi:hypothetical protein
MDWLKESTNSKKPLIILGIIAIARLLVENNSANLITFNLAFHKNLIQASSIFSSFLTTYLKADY